MGKDADALIDGLVTLPTIPSVLADINQKINDANSSAKDISDLIHTDQSIATKVLRIANSSFYAPRHKVTSIQHGVTILGTKVLRNIVLQATTIDAYSHLQGSTEFDLEEFWHHSVVVAITAQVLAKKAKNIFAKPDEYYSTGLIHDIGRVILLDSHPEKFLQAVKLAKTLAGGTVEAEQKIFGVDHTQIGSRLAQKWQLAEQTALDIENHHQLPSMTSSPAASGLLIYIADQIAHGLENSSQTPAKSPVKLEWYEKLGIGPDAVPGLLEQIGAAAASSDLTAA